MKGFKELLREFCMQGPIQGLKYFYLYPDPLSRCYWAICMLVAVFSAWMLVLRLYTRFSLMPTRITIEDQYAQVTTMPYPAITICSPNQISMPNVMHFKRTLVDGKEINMTEVLPLLLGFYEILPEFDAEPLRQLQNLISQNRHDVTSVMASLPQSCSEFLRICIYQEQLYPCSLFFKPIMTQHGLCCIFNSPYSYSKKHVRNIRNDNFTKWYPWIGGLHGSLTVVVDYMPQDAMIGTLLNAGSVKILFNDWTEFPADDESCLIYSNIEVFMMMYGTYTYCSDEVKTLPPQSRKCLFENENLGVRFPGMGYRNSDCDLMCLVRVIEQYCQCALFYTPGYRRGNMCVITDIPCIIDTKNKLSQIKEYTMCDCPRDCESRRYKIETNVGNLGALQHIINNPFKNVTMNQSSALLHFAFANPYYVIEKQETVMSLINLTSNMGGVFGLCLGCSAIGVLEFFFYIYRYIKYCLGKRRLRRIKPIQVKSKDQDLFITERFTRSHQ